MKRITFLLVITGTLSACNTTKGLGRDIQSGGQAMGKAAEKMTAC
ncbi:MAG: entericidin A/B family lipoprotein [Gallionellaceae bacterium]